MACHPYPVTLPLSCATDLLAIIRNGQFAAKIDQSMAHLWTLQGYGQRLVFGDPSLHQSFQAKLQEDDRDHRRKHYQSFMITVQKCIDESGKAGLCSGPHPSEVMAFKNDIIDFLDDLKTFMTKVLKWVYEMMGREWKHDDEPTPQPLPTVEHDPVQPQRYNFGEEEEGDCDED